MMIVVYQYVSPRLLMKVFYFYLGYSDLRKRIIQRERRHSLATYLLFRLCSSCRRKGTREHYVGGNVPMNKGILTLRHLFSCRGMLTGTFYSLPLTDEMIDVG